MHLLSTGATGVDGSSLQPAIPAEFTVEIGPDHQPAADTYVGITYRVHISTESEEFDNEIPTWFKTDASGRIRTGLRRGTHTVELDHLKKRESKELKINSDEPVKFTWHLQ